MSETKSPQNSMERYHARLWDMAERDPQVKALIPKGDIIEAAQTPGLSYAGIIETILRGYAERPALGERCYEVRPDAVTGRLSRAYLPAYATCTYADLRGRVEALASAWRGHGHHRVAMDEFICIFGFTSLDFTTVDLAAAYAHTATVPLSSTLAEPVLDRILDKIAPVALAVTVNDIELAAKLAVTNGKVKSIIVIDYDPRVDDERAKVEGAQAMIAQARVATQLTTIDHLIAFGSTYTWEPLPPHPEGPERIVAIMHSSGSTGSPKGVLVPERMAQHAWLVGPEGPRGPAPAVGVIVAPMTHFQGRYHVFSVLKVGGTGYYTLKPDMTTLLEDIRLVRPTFIGFFPRILDLIYQHYQSEIIGRTQKGDDPAAADVAIRAEMRASFLGDRVCIALVGSAPTAPKVRAFIEDCFEISLVDGYGSTEGGPIAFENRIVPAVTGYKLRDVPELGYYLTDTPYPRGELCIKSYCMTPGYFKDPESDAALFDENGYLCTGDIMEEHGPGHVFYIDRRNDVLKLSQGEFVAIGPLGRTFESGSAIIRQIYLYGDSSRSFLLAVVVPEMEAAAALIGHEPDEAELKVLIRSEIAQVARNANLKAFEVPRDFIIEMEPFSLENGLLSSLRKHMRPNFKRRYGERLEALYDQMERTRQEGVLALTDPNSTLTVLEKVVKALESSLDLDGLDPDTSLNFSELGGDSLGSVSFSMFLEDVFGVELPINAIVSPAGNPRRWAQQIEALLSADGDIPTFSKIHGKNARVLHAQDLAIERFLDAQTLDNIPAEAPAEDPSIVLLTGANGFLGRFLCITLLERVAAGGGKLICLIRAAGNEAARQRLDEVFAGVDPQLERHYHALAERHLEVIAADVAEPHFGLPQEDWDRLALEVDRIVHPAALVNHMLPYEHLFGPNVFGTAELIRLALTTRQKRFDFVSSMAAAYLTDTATGNNEDSPLLSSIPLSDDYASGYGASKWASEILLHGAHRRFGLPVNIFRGDMMLTHRRYKGQINVPDILTRLLYSIIMTGVAPESFYEPGPDGKRAHAHYDGLPVDFVAGAIVGIGEKAHREIKTFHVNNNHAEDGISLDMFVDWIESGGYPVKRIRDHAQWLQQFEARLSTMPEAQRQLSALAILKAFQQPAPARSSEIGCENFVTAVRDIPAGPEIPHLNERTIHKYLDDMRHLGLIKDVKVAAIAAAADA